MKRRKPYTEEELAEIAARYDTLQDFREKEESAYRAIYGRKLMDKLCSHMKRGHSVDYTEEDLAKIASRYTSLKEFCKKEHAASVAIYKHKYHHLLDHMERDRIYRTDEDLAEIASHYTVLSVFRKKERNSYNRICKRGLLDKLCGHMKHLRNPKTAEDLKKTAAKYKKVNELRKKDHATYLMIHKQGLAHILGGMDRRRRNPYTEEELADIASRYNDLKEFRKEESAAYSAMCRRGLLHLCDHMNKRIRHYTEEELVETTSKYDKLNEFTKDNPQMDQAIRRLGLGDKLYAHMKKHATERKYTEEELFEIASRYDTFKEFMEKESAIYQQISKRGLTDKICRHMKRLRPYRYSEEELAEVAAKYDSLTEFIEKEPKIYGTIQRRGLIDKLCGHMDRERVFRFSDEELAEIASKYNDLHEFITKEKGIYYAIKRHGLYKKLCGHMKRVGNRYKRKIYVFTFSDGYAYVGLAKDPDKRYEEHMSGGHGSPIVPHIEDTGATVEFKTLTDWLDKDEAAKAENDFIEKYKADGWKMLNKNKGGALGMMTWLYTDENIKREVNKYEYFEDFRKGSPRFYRYVMTKHLYDKYCSGMKHRKRRVKWTLNLAIKAAQECKNRSELGGKYYQAYDILKKAGLLDKYLPKQH